MKKKRNKSLKELAREVLGQLHEINQKVDHLIRRLPKNGHYPHDPQWNHCLD
jgi:predicted transglutaminase-like cysteine proteinase